MPFVEKGFAVAMLEPTMNADFTPNEDDPSMKHGVREKAIEFNGMLEMNASDRWIKRAAEEIRRNLAMAAADVFRVASTRNRLGLHMYGCLVQVGNGIELDTVSFRFEPYRWPPCGVNLDIAPRRTAVVIKLRRTVNLHL